MTSGFEHFEVRLQTFFEGLDFLAIRDKRVILVRKIMEELEEISKGTTSPGVISCRIEIHLAPDEYNQWSEQVDASILRRISDEIKTAAVSTRLINIASPAIHLLSDPRIAQGDLSIEVILDDASARSGDTSVLTLDDSDLYESTPSIPINASIILKDVDQIAITTPVVNIGRRKDNQIIINDPRVSRSHAQLRLINGRFAIFDLDSSGGTFVNNTRISQHILNSGDVISLAGYILIYIEEPITDASQTDKLIPKPSNGVANTTD